MAQHTQLYDYEPKEPVLLGGTHPSFLLTAELPGLLSRARRSSETLVILPNPWNAPPSMLTEKFTAAV